MKLIGILLVLNSIALTAWWITSQNNHKPMVITLCLIAVFAGLVLIFQDRITELTVKGVGTIKAATDQVQTDAKTVADLKERVENQSATVNLVAKEASKAKEISEEVADKNRQAEEKLNILDEAITKATATLANLDAATEFTMTVVAAQNDDRNAYDTLKKWSEDKKNPFSSRAAQAWSTIFESHNEPIY
jgi:chromosome segregation ATPase